MRTIPDPGFADDEGSPDPELESALAAHAADGRSAPVLVALGAARLLVPVVAVLEAAGSGEHGLPVDKSSDMAAVLMTGRDGRQALLAFSGVETLATWDASARPVPVSARLAAAAACQEGAAALVVDVAGPVPFVLQGDDLLRVAAGHRLVEVPGGHAWQPQTSVAAPAD
jgi:hypothetical protein